MFDYVDAKQISGVPFVILDEPIRIFKPSNEYYKEKAFEQFDFLPKSFVCYLKDDNLAPYDNFVDENGVEVANLIMFKEGEEKHVDYNFFNFPAPVMKEKEDGKVEAYKRKWLKPLYRVNAVLLEPTPVEVWDKQSKKRVPKEVTFVKIDLPTTAFAKFESNFETVKEAKEDKAMPISNVEALIKFDKSKPAGEMYEVKVKPTKKQINVEEALKEFESIQEDFVEPETPWLD